MGRLTPFGTLIVFVFLLLIVFGGLAATGNLRWPPFTISAAVSTPAAGLPAGTPGPPPPGAAEAATGVVPPPAGTPASTPPVAAAPSLSAVSGPASPLPAATATAVVPPTATMQPSPTRTPLPTSTPTHTPLPTATPTPTPLGLAFMGTIDVGSTGAQPAASDPDTHRLYVLSAGGQNQVVLSAYDEASLQKQGELPLDLQGATFDANVPLPVVVNTATHRVYVVGRNGAVVAVDSGNLTTVRLYNFGQQIERAFISPDGSKLYGLQRDQPGSTGPFLIVIDLRAVKVRGIHIPARWSADSAFADANALYLTGRDGLLPFDMRSDRFGSPLLLGFQPLFPVFDPGGHRLFAWRQPQVVPFTPELDVVDTTSAQVAARLTLAGCPCALAYTPASPRLYLAVAAAPGRVLAYSTTDGLVAHDEDVLQSVPVQAILASTSSPRIFVQTTGPHPILVLQDNGPAPAGHGPVVIPVTGR